MSRTSHSSPHAAQRRAQALQLQMDCAQRHVQAENHEAAIEVYERLLEQTVAHVAPNKEHPALARVLGAMGEALHEKGEAAEAEECFTRAVALLNANLEKDPTIDTPAWRNAGADPPAFSAPTFTAREYLAALGNIAHHAYATGQSHRVFTPQRNAHLNISRQHFQLQLTFAPPDSDEAIEAATNLGAVCIATGRYKDAIEVYEGALASADRRGRSDDDISEIHDNLHVARKRLTRYINARAQGTIAAAFKRYQKRCVERVRVVAFQRVFRGGIARRKLRLWVSAVRLRRLELPPAPTPTLWWLFGARDRTSAPAEGRDGAWNSRLSSPVGGVRRRSSVSPASPDMGDRRGSTLHSQTTALVESPFAPEDAEALAMAAEGEDGVGEQNNRPEYIRAKLSREKGQKCLASGDVEAAVGHYTNAVRLARHQLAIDDIESARCYVGLSRALEKSGKHAEAEAALAFAFEAVHDEFHAPSGVRDAVTAGEYHGVLGGLARLYNTLALKAPEQTLERVRLLEKAEACFLVLCETAPAAEKLQALSTLGGIRAYHQQQWEAGVAMLRRARAYAHAAPPEQVAALEEKLAKTEAAWVEIKQRHATRLVLWTWGRWRVSTACMTHRQGNICAMENYQRTEILEAEAWEGAYIENRAFAARLALEEEVRDFGLWNGSATPRSPLKSPRRVATSRPGSADRPPRAPRPLSATRSDDPRQAMRDSITAIRFARQAGDMAMEDEDYGTAISCFMQVKDLVGAAFPDAGRNHPELARAETGLGDAYAGFEDYENSERHYINALSILLERVDHDKLGARMRDGELVLVDTRRYDVSAPVKPFGPQGTPGDAPLSPSAPPRQRRRVSVATGLESAITRRDTMGGRQRRRSSVAASIGRQSTTRPGSAGSSQAESTFSDIVSSTHEELLAAIENVAFCYHRMGYDHPAFSTARLHEFRKARAYFELFLLAADDDSQTLSALANLGALLLAMGEYGDSVKTFKKALAVSEYVFGEEAPEMADPALRPQSPHSGFAPTVRAADASREFEVQYILEKLQVAVRRQQRWRKALAAATIYHAWKRRQRRSRFTQMLQAAEDAFANDVYTPEAAERAAMLQRLATEVGIITVVEEEFTMRQTLTAACVEERTLVYVADDDARKAIAKRAKQRRDVNNQETRVREEIASHEAAGRGDIEDAADQSLMRFAAERAEAALLAVEHTARGETVAEEGEARCHLAVDHVRGWEAARRAVVITAATAERTTLTAAASQQRGGIVARVAIVSDEASGRGDVSSAEAAAWTAFATDARGVLAITAQREVITAEATARVGIDAAATTAVAEGFTAWATTLAQLAADERSMVAAEAEARLAIAQEEDAALKDLSKNVEEMSTQGHAMMRTYERAQLEAAESSARASVVTACTAAFEGVRDAEGASRDMLAAHASAREGFCDDEAGARAECAVFEDHARNAIVDAYEEARRLQRETIEDAETTERYVVVGKEVGAWRVIGEAVEVSYTAQRENIESTEAHERAAIVEDEGLGVRAMADVVKGVFTEVLRATITDEERVREELTDTEVEEWTEIETQVVEVFKDQRTGFEFAETAERRIIESHEHIGSHRIGSLLRVAHAEQRAGLDDVETQERGWVVDDEISARDNFLERAYDDGCRMVFALCAALEAHEEETRATTLDDEAAVFGEALNLAREEGPEVAAAVCRRLVDSLVADEEQARAVIDVEAASLEHELYTSEDLVRLRVAAFPEERDVFASQEELARATLFKEETAAWGHIRFAASEAAAPILQRARMVAEEAAGRDAVAGEEAAAFDDLRMAAFVEAALHNVEAHVRVIRSEEEAARGELAAVYVLVNDEARCRAAILAEDFAERGALTHAAILRKDKIADRSGLRNATDIHESLARGAHEDAEAAAWKALLKGFADGIAEMDAERARRAAAREATVVDEAQARRVLRSDEANDRRYFARMATLDRFAMARKMVERQGRTVRGHMEDIAEAVFIELHARAAVEASAVTEWRGVVAGTLAGEEVIRRNDVAAEAALAWDEVEAREDQEVAEWEGFVKLAQARGADLLRIRIGDLAREALAALEATAGEDATARGALARRELRDRHVVERVLEEAGETAVRKTMQTSYLHAHAAIADVEAVERGEVSERRALWGDALAGIIDIVTTAVVEETAAARDGVVFQEDVLFRALVTQEATARADVILVAEAASRERLAHNATCTREEVWVRCVIEADECAGWDVCVVEESNALDKLMLDTSDRDGHYATEAAVRSGVVLEEARAWQEIGCTVRDAYDSVLSNAEEQQVVRATEAGAREAVVRSEIVDRRGIVQDEAGWRAWLVARAAARDACAVDETAARGVCEEEEAEARTDISNGDATGRRHITERDELMTAEVSRRDGVDAGEAADRRALLDLEELQRCHVQQRLDVAADAHRACGATASEEATVWADLLASEGILRRHTQEQVAVVREEDRERKVTTTEEVADRDAMMAAAALHKADMRARLALFADEGELRGGYEREGAQAWQELVEEQTADAARIARNQRARDALASEAYTLRGDTAGTEAADRSILAASEAAWRAKLIADRAARVAFEEEERGARDGVVADEATATRAIAATRILAHAQSEFIEEVCEEVRDLATDGLMELQAVVASEVKARKIAVKRARLRVIEEERIVQEAAEAAEDLAAQRREAAELRERELQERRERAAALRDVREGKAAEYARRRSVVVFQHIIETTRERAALIEAAETPKREAIAAQWYEQRIPVFAAEAVKAMKHLSHLALRGPLGYPNMKQFEIAQGKAVMARRKLVRAEAAEWRDILLQHDATVEGIRRAEAEARVVALMQKHTHKRFDDRRRAMELHRLQWVAGKRAENAPLLERAAKLVDRSAAALPALANAPQPMPLDANDIAANDGTVVAPTPRGASPHTAVGVCAGAGSPGTGVASLSQLRPMSLHPIGGVFYDACARAGVRPSRGLTKLFNLPDAEVTDVDVSKVPTSPALLTAVAEVLTHCHCVVTVNFASTDLQNAQLVAICNGLRSSAGTLESINVEYNPTLTSVGGNALVALVDDAPRMREVLVDRTAIPRSLRSMLSDRLLARAAGGDEESMPLELQVIHNTAAVATT